MKIEFADLNSSFADLNPLPEVRKCSPHGFSEKPNHQNAFGDDLKRKISFAQPSTMAVASVKIRVDNRRSTRWKHYSEQTNTGGREHGSVPASL